MISDGSGNGGTQPQNLNLESTESLLRRVKKGEDAARDALLCRYLVPLRKWAHGRLPGHARDLLDTDDLVQDTLVRTLRHLTSFIPDGDGAFLAYMRRVLLNRIHDQVRRAGRRPGQLALTEYLPAGDPSPLEDVIGCETLENYDLAMLSLPGHQQEAVMLRIEMGFSYEEIARSLGSPSPNAARMIVARALLKLAQVMKPAHETSE
ncbi:MAG TPA: sigma-70 family RNA polymerase sigma factor [Candidatus Polarisedimenticolia bacterium]|nr:sigma-70 family RNA polymerase sigma factor [Candidatus Polarisedimenticolia bacterium]